MVCISEAARLGSIAWRADRISAATPDPLINLTGSSTHDSNRKGNDRGRHPPLFAIGSVGIIGTAVVGGWASTSGKAKLYGAGAGGMGGGVVLIVLGNHHRSAK